MLRRAALLAALLLTAGCQVARTPAPVGVGLLRVGGPLRLSDRPALSPVAWAPDGKAVAFTDGGGVWIAPLDRTRGRERKVTAARHATHVDWSAGTGLLAYIDQGTLVMVRPDGSKKWRIPLIGAGGAPAFATHLAWAPRGDRLAVAAGDAASTGGGRRGGGVWLVGANGGSVRQVFEAPTGQAVGALGWYPNSLFLFIGIGPDGSVSRLLRWRIAYLDRRNLLVGFPTLLAPVLSPNGAWIAFAAPGAGGDHQVWVEAADGRSAPRKIEGGGGRIGGVTWAPSSDKIAFSRVLDEARGEIWIADVDGRGSRRIAQFVAEFPDPDLPLVARWSPDAAVIAYGSNSGNYTGHVWIVPLDRQ